MGVLTTAGIAKLAQAQQSGVPFDIDQIIFAYYPGLNPNTTPSVTSEKPPAGNIVYTAPVTAGYINGDTVVYKSTLLPTIGNFTFNWLGLFSSKSNTLVCVEYQEPQTKTKTEAFTTGNIIVKSFSIQYTQLKNLTGVTVRADLDSWDVLDLINKKADATHNHTISSVSGLQTALDEKSPTHAHPYSPIAHNHDDNYSSKNHSHTAYAPTSHAHLVSDITYLQLTLDAKAHVSHMHAGLVPVGTIIMGVRSTIPDGFLECNGAELSKAVYANLFNVIGIRFGSSTDGTKFKLPDLRGEFIRGWDNGRGVDASRTLGSFQAASTQLVGHNHIQLGAGEQAFDYLDSAGVPQIAIASGPDVSRSSKTTARWNPLTSTTGNSNETRPRNIAVQFFIKY